ncbi:hypothetical protein ORM77_25380 [Bacillus cereus]|uniref:GapS4a family protein n=1 Tax=Bacillus cereus TaxID=1396 RepID=UPI002ABED9E5|nr:hypothetical protein [Bacillus cereus]MDZ4621182.1 hypothetical protein [Bacillus cereus]
MGEKSKNSGEAGEKVAKNFLKLIGWSNILDGFDIPCVKPTKHEQKEGSKRKTHGVDFLTAYRCPFHNKKLEVAFISMKYRDAYKAETSSFKGFLKDIATAMECAKKSKINSLKQVHKVKKAANTGVVIWLAYQEDPSADAISGITDFRSIDDIHYESIYLVDNQRINFILGLLGFARKEFHDGEIEFFYPETGYNNDSFERTYSGKILPVQYINSSVLPLKIIDKNEEEYFILGVKDKFNAHSLKRLIGLSQKLTLAWGKRIIICFPNYHELTHGQEVKRVKLEFDDSRFIDKVEVRNYTFGDFRTLEEE